MTPTIDQFEVLDLDQFEILDNSVANDFFLNMTEEDADKILRSFPERNTDKFQNLLETDATNMLHVGDDLYLIRRAPGLEKRDCMNCAMFHHGLCYNNFRDGDGERGIPCEQKDWTLGADSGYHLARLKTVAMPMNGKKGKKEYVPDIPANFDFSEANWKSVRSMIGM